LSNAAFSWPLVNNLLTRTRTRTSLKKIGLEETR